jgi:hypothetical protein
VRKNTPLSTYIRGYVFLDTRVEGIQEEFAQGLTYFDSVVFRPILALAESAYQPPPPEVPLEEKLSNLVDDFNAKTDKRPNPFYTGKRPGQQNPGAGTETRGQIQLANLSDLR